MKEVYIDKELTDSLEEASLYMTDINMTLDEIDYTYSVYLFAINEDPVNAELLKKVDPILKELTTRINSKRIPEFRKKVDKYKSEIFEKELFNYLMMENKDQIYTYMNKITSKMQKIEKITDMYEKIKEILKVRELLKKLKIEIYIVKFKLG